MNQYITFNVRKDGIIKTVHEYGFHNLLDIITDVALNELKPSLFKIEKEILNENEINILVHGYYRILSDNIFNGFRNDVCGVLMKFCDFKEEINKYDTLLNNKIRNNDSIVLTHPHKKELKGDKTDWFLEYTGMQIFIQNRICGVVSLNVDPSWTIFDMQAAYKRKQGTPISKQTLTYNGIFLEHHRQMSHYNIRKESTIYIIANSNVPKSVTIHNQATHSNAKQKLNRCSICNEGFTRKSALKRHLKNH